MNVFFLYKVAQKGLSYSLRDPARAFLLPLAAWDKFIQSNLHFLAENCISCLGLPASRAPRKTCKLKLGTEGVHRTEEEAKNAATPMRQAAACV